MFVEKKKRCNQKSKAKKSKATAVLKEIKLRFDQSLGAGQAM
jgi:hypothetical protein